MCNCQRQTSCSSASRSRFPCQCPPHAQLRFESSCAAIIIDRSIVAPSSCGSSCSRARTCTAGWSTVVHRTTPQRPATAAHKNGRPGCHQRAKAEPPPARHAAAAACSSQLASALVLRPTACDRRHSHGLPASGGKGGGAVSKRSAAGDGACQRCSRASPDDSPVLIVRRAGGAASVERPAGDLARGLAEALHGWLLRGAGRTRVERWNAGRGVGAGELLGRGSMPLRHPNAQLGRRPGPCKASQSAIGGLDVASEHRHGRTGACTALAQPAPLPGTLSGSQHASKQQLYRDTFVFWLQPGRSHPTLPSGGPLQAHQRRAGTGPIRQYTCSLLPDLREGSTSGFQKCMQKHARGRPGLCHAPTLPAY